MRRQVGFNRLEKAGRNCSQCTSTTSMKDNFIEYTSFVYFCVYILCIGKGHQLIKNSITTQIAMTSIFVAWIRIDTMKPLLAFWRVHKNIYINQSTPWRIIDLNIISYIHGTGSLALHSRKCLQVFRPNLEQIKQSRKFTFYQKYS